MAAVRITPFNPATDDVVSWTSVLENFLLASGLDKTKADQQRKAVAVLLSSVGVPTYSLLTDLVSPKTPEEFSFEELVATLKTHYKPAPKAISERFKFYNRKQLPGESITVFVSELRRLAVTCKFDNLATSLRDQLVVGLSSEAAQKQLFTEDDTLALDKAVQIATSQEAAEASTRLIRGVQSQLPETAFKVQDQQSGQSSQKFNKSNSSQSCTKCGNNHQPNECPFKDVVCYNCNNKGHFAKYCRSSSKKDKNIKVVKVNSVHRRDSSIYVDIKVNSQKVKMELDTGSGRTFISIAVWKAIGSPKLEKCNVQFATYNGEKFKANGQFTCTVQYNEQCVDHTIVVTNNSCLFGRDLINKLQMDWPTIKLQCSQVNNVCPSESLELLLDEYKDVFDAPVGTIKNFKAKLVLKDDAVPRFFKARAVPFALRDKVDEELQKMEKSGVISRVEHSEWASPLVVVPKANGRIRITGNFKRTINAQLCVNQYPLARVDDLLETIAGGLSFSKLDGSDAFHQVEVDENCRKFLVINTQRGLYQYNVLPQGIAASPAIFQEMMDNMLHGIGNTGAFVDDCITTGRDANQHFNNLRLILQRMREVNYRLSRSKCEFMKNSIKFLGSIVSKDGIRTDPQKVEAIMAMKEPENVSDVKSFLGLVNFYGKFISHLSTLCEPLYHLTRKDVPWKWTQQCQRAFDNVKQSVSKSAILTHFEQQLPVGISCDASSVGLGVVLFHRCDDGSEKPIAFASKSLSSSEKNYSQIEKEGLSIIFGIKHFMRYLYGRRFILITDHNPLLGIFGSKKDVPSMVATRLHRWSLFLSGFSYDIEYRSTHQHGNADALSRLPVEDKFEVDEEASLIVKRIQEDNPITSKKVRFKTARDPVLCKVMNYMQSGWPQKSNQVPNDIRSFYSHRDEFSVEQGILMWGIRVVVPSALKGAVLDQLHDTHPGIVRMKSLARQYVWWPGIDSDVETMVKSCHTCAVNRDNPAAAPIHPWQFPEKPWQRIHMDLAGPFLQNMWLVVVDAYSKWPEVFQLGKDTSSANVIRRVRETFSRFGIPETIVTDNGPQFTSAEFEQFCVNNGVRHTTSSAYHPRSNGEAERFVRTFKSGMSACRGEDISLSLCDFLLTYRITPHSTTGVAPCDLLQKRKLRTLLDLMKPSVEVNVRENQQKQVEHGNKSPARQFEVGQEVWIRTFSKNRPTWSLGKVLDIRGPLTYTVEVDGCRYKRHVDHLFDGSVRNRTPVPDVDDDTEFLPVESPCQVPVEPEVVRRYPERERRPPDFYRS